MTKLNKGLLIGGITAITGMGYAASSSGVGVKSFKDHTTMQEIKKNCPDYYENKNGDCLRTSFRSVYFLRSSSGGGGFSGGK